MASTSANGEDDTETMKRQILANAPYAFPSLSRQQNDGNLLDLPLAPTFQILVKKSETDGGGSGGRFRAVLVAGPPGRAMTVAEAWPKFTLNEAVRSLLRLTAEMLYEASPPWASERMDTKDGTVAVGLRRRSFDRRTTFQATTWTRRFDGGKRAFLYLENSIGTGYDSQGPLACRSPRL